jgi:hypothetical protein
MSPSVLFTSEVKMRLVGLATASVLVISSAAVAQAQEVKQQQVQAVDLKAQATVAIDSMAADLTALNASNAKIVGSADGLVSLYSQLSDDFKKIVSTADRLRRTSQEPTPATAIQDDLIRQIYALQKQLAEMQGQFLALQNSIQQESRTYQTISNALTASHQAASNSIRNMK